MKLIKNVFDSKQKRALISGVTDSFEAVRPGLRDVTFVTIEEVNEHEWGIGGKAIGANDVEAHARHNLEG